MNYGLDKMFYEPLLTQPELKLWQSSLVSKHRNISSELQSFQQLAL